MLKLFFQLPSLLLLLLGLSSAASSDEVAASSSHRSFNDNQEVTRGGKRRILYKGYHSFNISGPMIDVNVIFFCSYGSEFLNLHKGYHWNFEYPHKGGK